MTLAELLMAVALTASVIAGMFTALGPAQASFATDQEHADLQQRLRVAADTLTRDLRAAASIRPYRTGAIGDDAAAGVRFRRDAISIVFPDALAMMPAGETRRSYYVKAAGDVWQLMQDDGRESAFPMLDDIIALGFEYFGDPLPPRTLPGSDPDDPAVPVTYGPAPPGMLTDRPEDAWGAGENCTFAAVGGEHVPRLALLGGVALAPLSATVLTDGPWCPDQMHADRFDADVLRIRLVRVRLRLQARTPFRGGAQVLFAHAGTASDVRRYVPDQEVRFDVAPRNWNAKPSP